MARTYVRVMGWREASNDQIDRAMDQFAALSSAAQARLCDLIAEVDVRQSWMTDGARSLSDWVTARLGVRHSTEKNRVAGGLRTVPIVLERERDNHFIHQRMTETRDLHPIAAVGLAALTVKHARAAAVGRGPRADTCAGRNGQL